MLLWFEAIHDLLNSDLQKNSAPLLSLTEEFYDYFLVRSMLGNEVSCCVSHILLSVNCSGQLTLLANQGDGSDCSRGAENKNAHPLTLTLTWRSCSTWAFLSRTKGTPLCGCNQTLLLSGLTCQPLQFRYGHFTLLAHEISLQPQNST